MPNRHDIHVLNDLITATLDSAERLDRVATDSETAGHVELFTGLAAERRDMAHSLQEMVITLGGQPGENPSILAKAQRAIQDVSHAILGDEAGLVATADKGEAALDKKFETAIADERLAATTRETLRRAHASIHREKDEIHGLTRSLEGQHDASNSLFPQ